MAIRISSAARKLKIAVSTAIETLAKHGEKVENQNTKLTDEQYNLLIEAFPNASVKKETVSSVSTGLEDVVIKSDADSNEIVEKTPIVEKISSSSQLEGITLVGKLEKKAEETVEETVEEDVPESAKDSEKEIVEKEKVESETKDESEKIVASETKDESNLPDEIITAQVKLEGVTVLGQMSEDELRKKQPIASSDETKEKKKKRRKRLNENKGSARKKFQKKNELSEKEIHDQIKATLTKLNADKNSRKNRAKYRKEKRQNIAEITKEKIKRDEAEKKVLKVSEFISADDLATLMDVSVNEVISSCMGLGVIVSINQRLDAELIQYLAMEFGYEVDFSSIDDDLLVETVEDSEDSLIDRAPIITIMGHVDHGKTSLLDYIRNAKVAEGEAGGITQHIGAYDLETKTGKNITFLDTPGHEAFTAMRARGAKVTDIVIIVIASDDAVMPQTKEAITHAQVAEVPIIIAINKIDREGSNPEKIKEELSQLNILVEDWGGKYQCQHISAKTGKGIDELLEKVLLEAEVLELKANPNKPALGTVIEAELDKGRGYVTSVLVQSGTLKVGDIVLAGSIHGKVKALNDHRGVALQEALPSKPVSILGFTGAPQAGDILNVLETDKKARELASKRGQIQREHSKRTKKHITLEEIGRRLAVGSFKELNVLIKGDVDGSVEAISDALLKLSTEEIQVNIVHKGVGQISEADVHLASASDSIIVGFQVRPSSSAKKLVETEEIEIRLYSIIYQVIEEIKDAMEGLLDPSVEEEITGNAEVREVYKISRLGTIAGCYVTDGSIKRQNKVRVVRDGIVTFTGEIAQLRRFKEDVSEVKSNYECGINLSNYNDLAKGDIIEGFEEKEVKRTLS